MVSFALVPVCCNVFLLGVQRSNAQSISSEETVSIDSIRSVWLQTRLDPVSLVFEVQTEERRAEYDMNGAAGLGEGGGLKDNSDRTYRRSSFKETWELIRSGERRVALRRISGSSPINGDFHPQYAFCDGKGSSVYAAPESESYKDGVVFGTRGIAAPGGLGRTVAMGVMLAWIDPASTREGLKLLETNVKELALSRHEAFGEIVTVDLPGETTAWFAKRFQWRPVKIVKSRNGAPLSEKSYNWKVEGDQVVLVSAKTRLLLPGFGEFCNNDYTVMHHSLSEMPSNRFQIEFPPKTVIIDSMEDTRRYFVKSENGVEREIHQHERSTAGPDGWAAIVKRDTAPAIDGRDVSDHRLYVAIVVIVLSIICVIAWRCRVAGLRLSS